MTKPKPTVKSAAILTIHGPGKMTRAGRKAIAEWLRRVTDHFVQYGEKYTTSRFTSRYLCNVKGSKRP